MSVSLKSTFVKVSVWDYTEKSCKTSHTPLFGGAVLAPCKHIPDYRRFSMFVQPSRYRYHQQGGEA